MVHVDLPVGWGHEENYIQRTTRDEAHDFNGYVKMTDSLPQMNQAPNQPYEGVVVLVTQT